MERALKMGVTAGATTTGVAFEGAAWAATTASSTTPRPSSCCSTPRTAPAGKDGAINDERRGCRSRAARCRPPTRRHQTWRQAYAARRTKYLAPLRRPKRPRRARRVGGRTRNVYVPGHLVRAARARVGEERHARNPSKRLQGPVALAAGTRRRLGARREEQRRSRRGRRYYAGRWRAASPTPTRGAAGHRVPLEQTGR